MIRFSDPQYRIFILAALIGVVLIYIRFLSDGFVLGTTTFDHPYVQFAGALIFGGLLSMLMIFALKTSSITRRAVYVMFGLGILYRALFIGSVPIYEDDWNRYLWDGAVTVQGINPYDYSPKEVIEGGQSDNQKIKRLHEYSVETGEITRRINYPELRTIYPPVAQVSFTVAAIIKPLNLDALRVVYLVIEALTFFLLVKTLQAYGRDEKWALLYILNPLLIYSGYNVAHMDLLLMPPLLLTMLWAKHRAPAKAAMALAVASAVKLWPLLLAPIVFRAWRKQPVIYIGIAVAVAVMSLLFNLPLLLSIGEGSGLSAYTGEWQRSSFIFPIIFAIYEPVSIAPGQFSRITIAVIVTLIALYYGFVAKVEDMKIPLAMMITVGVLLFLSPTGYPWYLYWVLIFLPFVPSYGFALLSGLVGLYYVRYAMGERGVYAWYENLVVPLQFGIPLLVIGYEILRSRRHVK